MKIVRVSYSLGKPGKSFLHSHTADEYILTVSGRGTLVLDGIGEMPFEKGTVVYVPSGVEHYNVSDEPYVHLAIIMESTSILPAGEYVFFDDANEVCKKIWLLALDVYKGNGSQRNELLESLAYTAASAIKERTQQFNAENPEVQVAMARIAERFSDPEFYVSDAVSNIGYSSAHFRKLFKEQTGFSLIGYLSYVRIKHAKRLLRYDKLSITAAAELSGFIDIRYFCRVFKKQTGKTPSEYAKSFR